MASKRTSCGIALIFTCVVLILPVTLLAQEGIRVVLHNEPRLVGGRVEASVSVNATSRAVVNLPASAFIVRENNRQVPPEELIVEPNAAGIGLVILIDRGGIAAQNSCQGPTNQLRISEAKTIASHLVNNLVIQVDGAADDMIAIIGIDPKDSEGKAFFWPEQNFSYNPVDQNLALNALEPLDAPERLLRDSSVTTPLYEGLYRALNLLTDNNDPTIRQALAVRQRMIVVFSDGIDREYSDVAIESDILRIADQHQIIIHAIGLACRDGSRLVENSLRRLAGQSQGNYWRHSSMEDHVVATAGLQNLLAYRQQYRLSFPSRLSSGTHRLFVQVTTETGVDEVNAQFISTLQVPKLTLSAPLDGYNVNEADVDTTTLPITATVEFGDGISREVVVQFSVNGAAVFTTTTLPYRYDWELDGLGVGSHVLEVTARDTQLGETLREERTIRIEAALTPTTVPVVPGPTPSTTGNLAILTIPILIILIILLFVLLYRTQSRVKQAIAAGARNVRSTTVKLTQKLGPAKPRWQS
jgi:hypothetical protein